MSSAAFIVAKQNQYLKRFQESGAVSPATAMELARVGCQDSRLFRRLVSQNVIREATEGKYYLDVEAAQAFRRTRHKRALTALVIILVILVVSLYFITKM